MNFPRPSGSSRWQTVTERISQVLLAGVFLYLIWTLSTGWSAVRELTFSGAWTDVAAAVSLSFLGYWCFPALWLSMLLNSSPETSPARGYLFRTWLKASLLRYIPGKVMVVLERTRLGALAGVPEPISITLLAWEQVLILIGSLFTLSLSVLLGVHGGEGGGMEFLRWAVPLVLAGMVCLRVLIRLAPRLPVIGYRLEPLGRLRFNLLYQLLFILGYGAAWLALSLGSALFFRWFVPLDWTELWLAATWVIVASVAGFLSAFAPAGLGIREGILVLGLSSIMPPGQAAALAIAGRIWTSLVETSSFFLSSLLPGPPQQTPLADLRNGIPSAGERPGEKSC